MIIYLLRKLCGQCWEKTWSLGLSYDQFIQPYVYLLLDHLSRMFTMWAYSIPIEPAISLSVLTNISATNRPIAIKFYLKHYWGGGKTA